MQGADNEMKFRPGGVSRPFLRRGRGIESTVVCWATSDGSPAKLTDFVMSREPHATGEGHFGTTLRTEWSNLHRKEPKKRRAVEIERP